MNQQNSFILPNTKSPILQLSVVFGAVLMSASARADHRPHFSSGQPDYQSS